MALSHKEPQNKGPESREDPSTKDPSSKPTLDASLKGFTYGKVVTSR